MQPTPVLRFPILSPLLAVLGLFALSGAWASVPELPAVQPATCEAQPDAGADVELASVAQVVLACLSNDFRDADEILRVAQLPGILEGGDLGARVP